MSTVNLATIQSNTALPPTIQNSSAVEIGTFCRAWVNFNGTGTVAIRASFNVSSITDNGTGDYTVNFTTAMPDVNYSVVGSCSFTLGGGNSFNTFIPSYTTAPTTGSCRVATGFNASPLDTAVVTVSVHR